MALPENLTDLAARARYEREDLLGISRALSWERDIHKLLDLIVLKSRQITGADAGSVYVVESKDVDGTSQSVGEPGRRAGFRGGKGAGACPHFMLWQHDSIAVNFRELTLTIDESSIVGKAVLSAQPINIADVVLP